MNSWSNSLQTGKTAYKPGEQVNTADQVTSPALFAAYQHETLVTSMYGCIHTSVGHLHVDGIARTLLGPSSEDLEVLFVDIELKALGSSWMVLQAALVSFLQYTWRWLMKVTVDPVTLSHPVHVWAWFLTAYACLLICFLTLCNANNAVCWPAHNPLYGLHTGQGVGISL